MASRALRSRTAEMNQENLDLPAGEKISEKQYVGLGSREPSEGLGSVEKLSEVD
jgi:hypothetical protein